MNIKGLFTLILVVVALVAAAEGQKGGGRGGRGGSRGGRHGGSPVGGRHGGGSRGGSRWGRPPFGRPGSRKPGKPIFIWPKPTPPKPTSGPVTTAAPIRECDCEEEISSLKAELDLIANPEVFSCINTDKEVKDEAVPVPYTSCYVSSPNMDISTGTFTVPTDGVYRLTFTARFSAMQGDSIRADMFVDDTKIARASNTLKNSPAGDVTDLETTSTITLLYDLKAGQEVYMMLKIQPCSECTMGMSTLQSAPAHPQILFTGEWIKASSASKA